MRFPKISHIFALALVATGATAASAPALPPDIPFIEHQRMVMNGRVIYEADVDAGNAKIRQFHLSIKADNYQWQYPALEGVIGSQAIGSVSSSGPARPGYSISYVVTDVDPQGSARVELVYSILDGSRGVRKTEHVSARVAFGKPFTQSTAEGTKVVILLSPDA